ncbi:MAG: nucleotidyltransferase substrate binding protein [bacterium]|nr:nucleotidyltransferase substrate binding protein [bacterium]
MALELESLSKAIGALGDLLAVGEDRRRMEQLTEVEQQGLRAGVIQYFEFTYELSWNAIKRWLQEDRDPSVTVGATRRHVFRIAAREGLIDNPEGMDGVHVRQEPDISHLQAGDRRPSLRRGSRIPASVPKATRNSRRLE